MENRSESGEYAAIGAQLQDRLNGRLMYMLRMATPVGLEPTTSSLEGWRSIRLSYGV